MEITARMRLMVNMPQKKRNTKLDNHGDHEVHRSKSDKKCVQNVQMTCSRTLAQLLSLRLCLVL